MQEYERKHQQLLRKLAPECTVLLKSSNILPLSAPCSIALYGSGARHTIKGGTGSGDVYVRSFASVEEALVNAGFTITTRQWLDAYDQEWQSARKRFISDIRKEARKQHINPAIYSMGAVMPEPDYNIPLNGTGNMAVYVLSRISGEGNDRRVVPGDFLLSETEVRDILEVYQKYPNFLLVLNTGGPVDLSPVMAVENILLLSQLGQVTGEVLADLMLGKAVPSGKLTATWAAKDDYCKEGTFGEPEDTEYREGIYVGYRYFERDGKRALFPFGYGKGYTDFRIEMLDVEQKKEILSVCAMVTNIGEHRGKETVQLYLSHPKGNLDHPLKVLAGFSKTMFLTPGESQEMMIVVNLWDVALYDEKKDTFVLEAGDYRLWLGSSSSDTEEIGGFTFLEEMILEKRREAPQISEQTKRLADSLNDEQLASLCVGSYAEKEGISSIIGNAAQHVAGAAGETTGKIKGLPYLIMADGPAGLRLAREYIKDGIGVHALGNPIVEQMAEFMNPLIRRLLLKVILKKPKGEVFYQFCTAIPIGTALAQSWNGKLWEACGDIVGEEMQLFGIHLWLAPAFNIQRNPLCGRNFEYASEDPLLSGYFGAAITKGVQKHSGCAVTIKHFCCNNQEFNRYQSNSVVPQRALREIYLRPFEICIREAKPLALMTSYNLLNGIHTSEKADLLKGILRSEWGFQGLIMSDWIVPSAKNSRLKYSVSTVVPSIKAGNDLFMPGSAQDYKELMEALREGKLTREELQYCAEHVIETVFKLIEK